MKDEIMEMIKTNGFILKLVEEQTKEICLEAVKQNGRLLKYVNHNVLNENEHYIFKNKNTRKVYVNKIDGEWLFSIGYQNNITKDQFI